MRKPGFLIFHPDAGKGPPDRFESLVSILHANGLEFEVCELTGERTASGAAAHALTTDAAWIAAAGGDGTVEAVAEKLVGADLPLGVIPMGTYNNFARSLGIPLEIDEACRVIATAPGRPIDVGFVNGEPFFECVGAGLDAALFPMSEEIKSGKFARFVDLLRRAYSFRREKFIITLDRPACEALAPGNANESHSLIHRISRHRSSTIALSALMVTVSNGPLYGMNFAVAPDQRMNDGHLTVSVFSRYSKPQLWWHFLSIAFGRREYNPKSISFRVRKTSIDGPVDLPTHSDGSPRKFWPLQAECRPAALRVFH